MLGTLQGSILLYKIRSEHELCLDLIHEGIVVKGKEIQKLTYFETLAVVLILCRKAYALFSFLDM